MKILKTTSALCLALLFCTCALAQSSSKLFYPDQSSQTDDAHIHILDAVYGQDERLCNARDKVARSCDDHQSCRINANDRLCGNPYRNVRKDFFVAYDCGDGRRTLTVSEGEQAYIYCAFEGDHDDDYGQSPQPPRNWQRSRIYVAQALYGIESSSCDATDRFVQSCNEQANCYVKVNNNLCGDPARGQRKSAEITCWCDGQLQALQVRENGTAALNCR